MDIQADTLRMKKWENGSLIIIYYVIVKMKKNIVCVHCFDVKLCIMSRAYFIKIKLPWIRCFFKSVLFEKKIFFKYK